MSGVREAARDLLAETPTLADPLGELLDIDENGAFEFDEIPLDSGQFGEVVDAGIVEQTGNGYQVADRKALIQALHAHAESNNTSSPTRFESSTSDKKEASPSLIVASIRGMFNNSIPLALVGALFVVVLTRVVIMWPQVFRSGDIVLAGNDPYYYRYWVETLLSGQLSAWDLHALTELPGNLKTSETLLIIAVWWMSALLGGNSHAVGVVLAWYPILAAIVTAIGCYLLSVWLTADRRIGLAAVLILAVIPAHGYRTALGFGDHHAFDYIWLTLIVLAVIFIVRTRHQTYRKTKGQTLLAVSALGIGIAAQSHAWRGGPLLSLPLGLFLFVQVIHDVQSGHSPLRRQSPLLAGLAVGAFISATVHGIFGWAVRYQAVAPAALTLGAIGVVLIGEVAHRQEFSMKTTVGVQVIASIGGVGAILLIFPEVTQATQQLVEFFLRLSESGIAETYSIVSSELGTVIGPIFAFGFFFFLALPYLAWGTWYGWQSNRPEWLAMTMFGWYLLLLTTIQVRFAGHLSIFTAVFGGLGFVHLAALIDIADRPAILGGEETAATETRGTGGDTADRTSSSLTQLSVPTRRTMATLFVVFILIASPGIVFTGIRQMQIGIDTETYQTATWIEHYSTTNSQTYPENYVFSPWSQNRVYNYFVNGESRSYAYARANYGEFLRSTESGKWYQILSQKPTGYVVIKPQSGSIPEQSLQARLWNHWGSYHTGVSGVGHYRAVYATSDTKVYEVVPGAVIKGQGASGKEYMVTTEFAVNGTTHTFERRVRVNSNGRYAVRVPYNGTYQVGTQEIQVSETAVQTGNVANVTKRAR